MMEFVKCDEMEPSKEEQHIHTKLGPKKEKLFKNKTTQIREQHNGYTDSFNPFVNGLSYSSKCIIIII